MPPRKTLTPEQRARKAAYQREYRKRSQPHQPPDPFGEDLFNIGMDLYTHTRDDEAKDHIRSLLDLQPYRSIPLKPSKSAEAAAQINEAYRGLGGGFAIHFDRLDPIGIEHMKRYLGPILEKFIKGIDYSDKWVAIYQYGNEMSRIRPIDEITSAQLYNQLFEEGFLQPGTVEYSDPFESGGQFIPYFIESLNSIRFVNLRYHNLDGSELSPVLKKLTSFNMKLLKASNADAILEPDQLTMITESLKRNSKNKRREGRFWPWKLTIPHINLERYMIFNSIDQRTAHIIEGDNCLIYACKMAGVDEAKLNHMRNVIKIRSFSLAKLKVIAEECQLSFTVVDGSNYKAFHIGGNPSELPLSIPSMRRGCPSVSTSPISLLLYEGHYMLNERVPISPYFIHHCSEIMRSHQTRWWTMNEKLLTRGQKASGEYVKAEKCSHKLITVLKAIFEVGGFKEIRYGDFMTYSSTLYASKLKGTVNLNYEPRYCCRLKGNKAVAAEEIPL